LNWRSPAILTAIGGVVATLVLALAVVITLLQTGGAEAVSDNVALIGAVVALGGIFTTQMVSIALEDQRTRDARTLETQRAQEAALQSYFERIGKLLADPHRPLRRSTLGDNLSTVARAQTLSFLQSIDDPVRKRILLEFLHQARLIYRDYPVVSLHRANLGRVYLHGVNLSRAYLSRADLREANLSEADLYDADLRGADLRSANLKGADLRRANLKGARGVTKEQLERQTEHLQGATMPDGTTHD
jgi:hypothetical protein